MLDTIKNTFTESIQTQIYAVETLSETINLAANTIISALLNGNKVLCCGNGANAANAQQFVAYFLNRFETERPSLPAFDLCSSTPTLTAIANDYQYQDVFAKQIKALGSAGDILLAFSTSGNSENITNAIEAAFTRDMTIVAMTGQDGGKIATLLSQNDIEIRIPSNHTARIHELHLLTLHCLCDVIDQTIFPIHEG